MDSVLEAPIELLTSPWLTAFHNLVSLAKEELLVVSPFLSNEPLKNILEIIRDKQSISINVVTNLAINSLLSGALDVAALLRFAQSVPNMTITYLPNLHAKVYIADTKVAVVTSANLTFNGLAGNYEYGVLLRDPVLVE
jgi:phosphatidylserine/phosphatidylglycerophosphate/cardiolipin synthase-like enzyme